VWLLLLLQVYAWFLATYKVSVFVGMCGYFLLVLDMFGVGLLMARYVEPGEHTLSARASGCNMLTMPDCRRLVLVLTALQQAKETMCLDPT
jgi:phosphopentomutase